MERFTMFKVDEVQASQGFENIPDGVYKVVLAEASHVSDEKSTRFEFTFVHPEGAYRNRKHWARHMYIGGAMTKPETVNSNKALLADLFFVFGVKGFETEDEAHDICGRIVGNECYIKLRSNEYQGKTYQNVDGYWTTDGNNRSGKKLPTNTTQAKAKSSYVAPAVEDGVPF